MGKLSHWHGSLPSDQKNDLPPQSKKDRKQFHCQTTRDQRIWQMRLNSGSLGT